MTMLPNGDMHIVLVTTNMTTKIITIAVILAVAMIAGMVVATTTTTITAAHADESETEIDQKCKGKNLASGDSPVIVNDLDCIIG
jgi:mannose/fructose/N-acetylgalactosamine-specific phosphotransferase system component IIC